MTKPTPASEMLSMDVTEIVEAIQAALRSVGAEVASPWFYLQFGLILAAAGTAWAADGAIRSRVDLSSLAMRWPLPLRHFVRMMVFSASTAIFAILMVVARAIMLHATPLGLRLTKEALNHAIDAQGLEAVIAMEDRNQILATRGEDFGEGVQAFLEKRKPVYGKK